MTAHRRTWVALTEPYTFVKGLLVRRAPAGTFVRLETDDDKIAQSQGLVKISLEWQGQKIVARVERRLIDDLGGKSEDRASDSRS